MEASLEDCFRDANVTSSCLSGYCVAIRCNSGFSRDHTVASAPTEQELSGEQHMRMCPPDLPTAVTP
jgi:hypothetical protein